MLDFLKSLLADELYGVKTTTDPDEAMEIIARERIKVVVSDQRMPKISGIEFFRNIKKKYPEVTRVLLTGHTDFEIAEKAINIGEVYRFIAKPWKTAELKTAVKQSIEHFDLLAKNRLLFKKTKKRKEELEICNLQLNSLYEVQTNFTSTVSHELRTPLAAIKTNIDIVIDGTAGEINTHQRKFLTKSKNNVDRLGRLIDDILDLSKLGSGQIKLKFKKHNINEVVKKVIENEKPVAEKRGLYLKTELDLSIPETLFDKDKIIQVLENLLNNAIKFTEEGGIVVSSDNNQKDNCVRLSVKDTGHGIKQEHLSRLFKKFQQLGDPAKRRTGGTGLGLVICQEIVKQHGGKIWAESQKGEGSSFYFNLPNSRKEGRVNHE